jgi:hypothetical protein
MAEAHPSQERVPPSIHASEIGSFLDQLSPTILDLEGAWEQGRLPTGLRQAAVEILLRYVWQDLIEPRRWYEATGRPSGEIRALGPDGEVALRFDQVASARGWGIGFRLSDPEAADTLSTRLVGSAVTRLAAHLRGLDRVEERFRDTPSLEEVRPLPPPFARRFEQLMIDILNEYQLTTRRAPFREDFFEKTDLRFKLPDLQRSRGARIQVTQVVDAAQHHSKLEKIRLAEEFVILSPLTLARAVARQSLLPLVEKVRFWECFSTPRLPVPQLARTIYDAFQKAIGQAQDHPLGPLHFVPQPLRELVQLYVATEARRTTRHLRRRETMARGGAYNGPSR